MSNINAESVKTKLQSLITASNAKTGKSDTNLTDAVNTLLERYGQGGGNGECSGNHIIEVDELPEVGEEGKIYGIKGVLDAVLVSQGTTTSLSSGGSDVSGIIATSETLPTIEPVMSMICYVTDIPELYMYYGSWKPFSELLGGGQCLGEIADISEADTSTDGYYAVVGFVDLYQYVGGKFRKLLLKGDLVYTSNNDGTCYVSALEDYYDTEIVIPSISPSGDTVTAIGAEAFQGCKNLERITIPDSVTSIGNHAFSLCKSLEYIAIPDGVTSIGDNTFFACGNLSSITIPNSVTSIGNHAFNQCYKLSSSSTFKIPDSVASIGANAFYYCHSIRSITIPDGVTSISAYAFSCCYGLQEITIPNSVTSIGDYAFMSSSSITSITIPNSVTSIGRMAFNNCTGLTSINIPSSVTIIGYSVFSGCSNLPSITIPDSVTSIGTNAFQNCSSLTSITFGGTVEQWNAITKGTNWNKNVPATEVTCSDGTVTL